MPQGTPPVFRWGSLKIADHRTLVIVCVTLVAIVFFVTEVPSLRIVWKELSAFFPRTN